MRKIDPGVRASPERRQALLHWLDESKDNERLIQAAQEAPADHVREATDYLKFLKEADEFFKHPDEVFNQDDEDL